MTRDEMDDRADKFLIIASRPGSYRAPAPVRLGWKDQLQAVEMNMQDRKAPAAAWPSERRIWYVINVERSLTNGGLVVEVRSRDAAGQAKLNVPKLRVSDVPRVPDASDRQILTLIAAAQPSWDRYDSMDRAVPRYASVASIEAVLVPMICATGRCLLRTDRDGPLEPVVWDGDAPWSFVTQIRRAPGGDDYLVGGVFKRGDELAPAGRRLVTTTGLIIWPGRVGRLADARILPWSAHLAQHGPLAVPAAQGHGFLEKLLALPVPLDLDLPEGLRYEEAHFLPRPRLRVRRAREWGADYLRGDVSFDYGGEFIPASRPGRGVLKNDPRRLIVRDAAAENEAAGRLAKAGFKPRAIYSSYEATTALALPAPKLARVVAALVRDGWHVEADGKLYRHAGTIRIEVTSGVDWFDVKGRVTFGNAEIGLPALLAAARKGEPTVVLGDGSFGILPEDWLQRHGFLAGLGTVEGDGLRFTARQVGVLDALLSTLPEATWDATFARAREALGTFDGVHPADPPPDFAGRLREYQREGLGWFDFLRRFGFGGCLADDMGLGKTVQVLALLDARRAERERTKSGGDAASIRPASLVVVPRSLVFNWLQEATRFTPKLRVLDHTGTGRFREGTRLEDWDVVLTTYGTLRRDAVRLRAVPFDYVVLDEAQAIKNGTTDSAKAAKLVQGDHKLALSGTPVQNHLGELWSLFEFLNPGMLGARATLGTASAVREVDEDTRALVARAVRPLVLRRTKAQVAPELPARIEQTLYCELEGDQRTRYDELREHYRRALMGRVARDGVARSAIQVLEALLRLRQAACHPGLIDKTRAGEPSAKLDVLLARLAEVAEGGHQALVFSQFTSFLAIVRARLDRARIAYEYLDGKTRDRAAPVERFQADPGRHVFLVSLTAGGLGLNLTAAEYVFLLDPWWNPAVEAQAIDRAHRIGQTRTVCAYRVIARDTVEEKILELQRTKRDLADAIITADHSLVGSLTAEDLERLLS